MIKNDLYKKNKNKAGWSYAAREKYFGNSHYVQGFFNPKNISKCINKKYPINYKSNLELTLLNKLDKNENVISWGYETTVIPYIFNNETKKYYLDFFVKIKDIDNIINLYYIESKDDTMIKYYNEYLKYKKIPNSNLFKNKESYKYLMNQFTLNILKWDATLKICKKNNIHFIIQGEKYRIILN